MRALPAEAVVVLECGHWQDHDEARQTYLRADCPYGDGVVDVLGVVQSGDWEDPS